MFGLSGSELFWVFLLAFIFIGPKDLPKMATKLGRWYRQLKMATQDFKETIEKEIDTEDEAPTKPS